VKVTLITMAYPWPTPGFWPGIERQVGELAIALRDAGASVRIITSFRNGGMAREERDGIQIARVRDDGQRLGRLGSLFSWHVKSFGQRAIGVRELIDDADVIESFVPLPRASVLRRRGLALIGFFAHRDRPRRLREYVVHPFRFLMDRAFFQFADAVIVATTESRRVLLEEYDLPAARAFVIPLGVPHAFLTRIAGEKSTSSPAREGTGPEHEQRPLRGPAQLLFVGPLVRRKGLHSLLEALRLVMKEGLSFRLSIAGDGPERSSLQREAARTSVGEFVTFEGRVSDQRLIQLYESADVFVFPSHQEGFGLVLVEAMSFGLPIVACEVPPIPEVVGDAAILVGANDPRALADGLIKVLGDADLRARIAERAVTRARDRYGWARIGRETLDLFDELRTRSTASSKHRTHAERRGSGTP
jgi:glycosyltransferase involved in cell wall biosynthesis